MIAARPEGLALASLRRFKAAALRIVRAIPSEWTDCGPPFHVLSDGTVF
jgi:hypothetical protein